MRVWTLLVVKSSIQQMEHTRSIFDSAVAAYVGGVIDAG